MCQIVGGARLSRTVEGLVLQALQPFGVEAALAAVFAGASTVG